MDGCFLMTFNTSSPSRFSEASGQRNACHRIGPNDKRKPGYISESKHLRQLFWGSESNGPTPSIYIHRERATRHKKTNAVERVIGINTIMFMKQVSHGNTFRGVERVNSRETSKVTERAKVGEMLIITKRAIQNEAFRLAERVTRIKKPRDHKRATLPDTPRLVKRASHRKTNTLLKRVNNV